MEPKLCLETLRRAYVDGKWDGHRAACDALVPALREAVDFMEAMYETMPEHIKVSIETRRENVRALLAKGRGET
jgi:hypothetical protein